MKNYKDIIIEYVPYNNIIENNVTYLEHVCNTTYHVEKQEDIEMFKNMFRQRCYQYNPIKLDYTKFEDKISNEYYNIIIDIYKYVEKGSK